MHSTELPIHEILGDIRDRLARVDTLIVQAPPGAGKTTVVPLALADEPWLAGRRIVMLQPRRLAAKNTALRMAALLGEKVGERVGYRMRLDTRVGANTIVEVVTEGVLLRMLRQDPSLADVGLLIFDEFHERSLDADLGLALALYGRSTFESEAALKVLVMSATLAARELATLLGAEVLHSEGRLFPVEVHYGSAMQARERSVDRVAAAIERALTRHPDSSVLAFLPGQGEIRRLAGQLVTAPDVAVHPLYGDLDLRDQQRAIEPCPPGQRKVVLATNIAETSLTIEGVDVVVDSGLERVPAFDPNTAMSRLETVRISRASSEQRMGRAGRLRPGSCYRLWSASQQEQLNPGQVPEIQRADLAPMVLQLFAWGIYDPGELDWLTPPPPGPYAQAVDLLMLLGAVEKVAGEPRLSAHGMAMAELPAHPRLAHMLLKARDVGEVDTAAFMAAVLSDRDPLTRESPDMQLRIDYLSGALPCPAALRGWLHRCRRLADQLAYQLPPGTGGAGPAPGRSLSAEQVPGFLIACAYPDRIARARHGGGFQLANGRSCQFLGAEALSRHKWLAVAEIGGMAGRRGDHIRSAARLDPALFESLLADTISERSVVEWEQKSGRFVAEQQRRCGALLLARERLADVPAQARIDKLLEMIRADRMASLPWKGDADDYRNRARLMGSLDPAWPAFDDETLLNTAGEWLAPFLHPVSRLTDLKRLDLLAALRSRLSWEQQQQLERWLPERLEVPSGSRIRIDYAANPPVLAVKLQEMFGCERTPAVAEGRVPLLVHLLSPAGRPLQVTRDLEGFWRTGYAEVKKEMKGRYPKHPWPEDPLSARPTRHTKQRGEAR